MCRKALHPVPEEEYKIFSFYILNNLLFQEVSIVLTQNCRLHMCINVYCGLVHSLTLSTLVGNLK